MKLNKELLLDRLKQSGALIIDALKTRLFRRVIFITIIIAILTSFTSVIPYVIGKEKIEASLIHSFKAYTGLNVRVQGFTDIDLFPVPHLKANSLYIYNESGSFSPYFVSVNYFDAKLSITSLLKGVIDITEIRLKGVDIELERMKNKQFNWNRLITISTNAPQVDDSKFVVRFLTIPKIVISDTVVRYTDSVRGSVVDYSNVTASLINDVSQNKSDLNISFTYAGRPILLNFSSNHLEDEINRKLISLKGSISNENSKISAVGDFGFKDNQFFIQGKLNADTDDILTWVNILRTGKPPVKSKVELPVIPMQISSDISSEKDTDTLLLPNIILTSGVVKGELQAKLQLPYHLQLKGTIDSLVLDSLFDSKLLTENAPVEKVRDEDVSAAVFTDKSYFDFLITDANLQIKDTEYKGYHLKDMSLDFNFANKELTISNALANLPGDSRLVFVGIGKSDIEGPSLEGEVDITGKDFMDAASLFITRDVSVPSDDFKRFKFKANAALTLKDLRLSEITARIENIGVIGGVVAKFGKSQDIQAILQASGLNLDHFIAVSGFKEWYTDKRASDPIAPKGNALVSRMNRIKNTTKLSLALNNYIFNGSLRERALIKAEIIPGRIFFPEFNLNYNGSQFSGAAMLGSADSLPRLDLDLNIDAIDVEKLFGKNDDEVNPDDADKTKKNEWMHSVMDFHWFDLLDAKYHVLCGAYKNGKLEAESIEIRGIVKDHKLSLDAFDATMLGARFLGKSTITGGKIPEFTIEANIVNLSTEKVSRIFTFMDKMTGNYNISLRLASSGIDFYRWLVNMEGNIGIAGRDVTIQSFDIPAIVREVSYVRTVADILNVVKRSFPGGATVFSLIEGHWYVSGGVLKTPEIKLYTEGTEGKFVGNIDIVNWETQGKVIFSLKQLDAVKPPTISIYFSGDLDKPKSTLDTSVLEQYVTGKTSEKILQQYDVH